MSLPADIFERYRLKVYRLAISIVRNEKDAEDVLQNTFLKIVANYGKFQKKSSLGTWIYRIAYNESLMLLRRRSGQFKAYGRFIRDNRSLPSGMFINWVKLPDEELLNKELRGRISKALKNLPIAYRMPLILHAMERLPLEAAADVLNIREASLKSRLHRAYLKIHEALRDYESDKEIFIKPGGRGCYPRMRFVQQIAEKKLPVAKLLAFNRHISDCPECRSFLKNYAQAIRITGALECRDIPPLLLRKIDNFVQKKRNLPAVCASK